MVVGLDVDGRGRRVRPLLLARTLHGNTTNNSTSQHHPLGQLAIMTTTVTCCHGHVAAYLPTVTQKLMEEVTSGL